MEVIEHKNKSIFKTYMIYFIVVILFVVLRILVAENILVLSDDSFINNIFLNVILQIGILFLIPMILYTTLNKVTPKQVFKTCNFNLVNYKVILMAIVFGVLAFVLNSILSSVAGGLLSIVGYHSNSVSVATTYEMKDFIADIFLTALLPAFCEEFMHRGILLQGTKHAGFKQAIIISSICFGLAHLNIEQVFYAIPMGIFLGVMAVATKSIIPSIIVHFMNNFIVVYLNGATAFGWFGGNYADWFRMLFERVGTVWIMVIIGLVFFATLIILAVLIYLMYKECIVKKMEKVLIKEYNTKVKLDSESKDEVSLEARKVVRDSTCVNLDDEEVKDLFDFVVPKQKYVYKKTFKDNIFIIASIVLASIVTIFTFIWGLL